MNYYLFCIVILLILIWLLIIKIFKINYELKFLDKENKKYIHELELLKTDNNKYKDLYNIEKDKNLKFQIKYEEINSSVINNKKNQDDYYNYIKNEFKSICQELLINNNKQFISIANHELDKYITKSKYTIEKETNNITNLVKPLSDMLNKFDVKMNNLEKNRQGAYSEIKTFLDTMIDSNIRLQKETNNLVSALKNTNTRGKYGEIGLRRIIEFSGMTSFCDFNEQKNFETDEKEIFRPDLIVHMPGNRNIIIDSKLPLDYYLMAHEEYDENLKNKYLNKHVKSIYDHIKKLGNKNYSTKYYKTSPDYVIMYMQIESSFVNALQLDPNIIEKAINNKIVIATPSTLISMLKTIEFSWQQLKVAENIDKMKDYVIDLYNRTHILISHISSIGNNLEQATISYNKSIGSLESRFMPQIKKIKELGGSLMDKEPPELKHIDKRIRDISNNFG